MREKSKRELDQRRELAQDYGLETVRPMAGNSFTTVYDEVKKQGGFVKERMAANKEKENAKILAKRRAWLPEARRRAPKKGRIMMEQKAREESAKRTIRL